MPGENRSQLLNQLLNQLLKLLKRVLKRVLKIPPLARARPRPFSMAKRLVYYPLRNLRFLPPLLKNHPDNLRSRSYVSSSATSWPEKSSSTGIANALR